MRVHELIKELDKCDPDAIVCMEDDCQEYEVSRVYTGDEGIASKFVLIR